MKPQSIPLRYFPEVSFAWPMAGSSVGGKRRKSNHAPRHWREAQPNEPWLVRLEFFHPRARKVNIAGSFNDWRPGATWMVPTGGGRWIKTLLLAPGVYACRFLVDEDWPPKLPTEESGLLVGENEVFALTVPRAKPFDPSNPFSRQSLPRLTISEALLNPQTKERNCQ